MTAEMRISSTLYLSNALSRQVKLTDRSSASSSVIKEDVLLSFILSDPCEHRREVILEIIRHKDELPDFNMEKLYETYLLVKLVFAKDACLKRRVAMYTPNIGDGVWQENPDGLRDL